MPENETARVKAQERFEEDIRSTLTIMQFGPRESRMGAWENLKAGLDSFRGKISKELARELGKIYMVEKDEGVAVFASRIVPLVVLWSELGTPVRLANNPPKVLSDWLWHDFRHPSHVLRVADPGRLRRDEDAVIEIARSLSRAEFPHTEFLCVDSRGFAPEMAQLERVVALCFVGRLSLFGRDAVHSWSGARPWHYRFAMESRPKDLKRGELHPQYHSLVRDGAKNDGEAVYRTEETNSRRIDYGLIRRHVVSSSGRSVVVVQIAGCSSLATRAVAHFAAYTLFFPGLNRKLIPTPPGIHAESHLEALIQVEAKTEGSEFGWSMQELRLLDLRVDNFRWNEDEFRWVPASRATINVTFPNVAARRSPFGRMSEIKIRIDDAPAGFRADSENHRLFLALCMAAAEQEDGVTLDDLGNNRQIWDDNSAKDAAYVTRRLRSIKRLRDLYAIDGCVCRMLSDIRLQIDKPTQPR
ncbi:MAG TPA: hypothetical protein DD670_03715 [Planctomycetaceae bacterium]|nr:hypothetical protein [Planctomycetaceae bacterium]